MPVGRPRTFGADLFTVYLINGKLSAISKDDLDFQASLTFSSVATASISNFSAGSSL
jgi:hypothetical protein